MRHRFKTSTFRIVSFVIVSIAVAGSADAQTVTLESLETATLDDHPQLGRRRAEIRAAATRVDAARAEMRPSLYLDLGVLAAPGLAMPQIRLDDEHVLNSSTSSLLEPYFRYSAALRFDGPLYDFGRTAARVDAVEAEIAATSAESLAAREDLVRGTRAAYLRWLGAYEQRHIVEGSLAIAETRASQVDEAVRAGARPGADREMAAFEVARARLALARARAEESDQRAALGLASRVAIPEDAVPDAQWLENASADVPLPTPAAIAAIELRREAIGASLRAIRRRYNPVLGISVRLGAWVQNVTETDTQGTEDIADDESRDRLWPVPSYSVQIGLSMPLWDPRLGPHVRREAEARQDALDAAEADLRTQFDAERSRAEIALERANEQTALAAEAVRIAGSIATNSEERYRAVGGSLETVIAARQRELSARADLLQAQSALASARMRLQPIR